MAVRVRLVHIATTWKRERLTHPRPSMYGMATSCCIHVTSIYDPNASIPVRMVHPTIRRFERGPRSCFRCVPIPGAVNGRVPPHRESRGVWPFLGGALHRNAHQDYLCLPLTFLVDDRWVMVVPRCVNGVPTREVDGNQVRRGDS